MERDEVEQIKEKIEYLISQGELALNPKERLLVRGALGSLLKRYYKLTDCHYDGGLENE